MNVLREASHYTQVLATTHSPELLDDLELDAETLLAVDAYAGKTTIGAVNEASRSALREKLYTAGELLKLDQLKPEPPEPMEATFADDEDEDLPLFRTQQ